MGRADGNISVTADTIEELAAKMNAIRQVYAVHSAQVFQPNDTIAKWSAMMYYAMKFPEGMGEQ